MIVENMTVRKIVVLRKNYHGKICVRKMTVLTKTTVDKYDLI
jgi:hypothetical protein